MKARTHWVLDNDALATLRPRRSSKYFPGSLLLIALALFSSGCVREIASNPAERLLVGRWKTASTNIGAGSEIPGEGSYLEFDVCEAGECTGTDYLARDGTTGSITYALAADGQAITITDTTPDGGAYGGTWKIMELNEAELHIGIETGGRILRGMVIKLERVR